MTLGTVCIEKLWLEVSPGPEGAMTIGSSVNTFRKSDEALDSIGQLVEDRLLREVDEADGAAAWRQQ